MVRGPLRDATTDLAIPNLARLVARLRDKSLAGCVTIVHATNTAEGEFTLSLAAARLERYAIKSFGPEESTVADGIEYGARIGAKVIFAGVLRRPDDGRALRAAAKVGLKVAGIVTGHFAEAQTMVKALGPWAGYDLDFFSMASAPQHELGEG